MKVGEFKGKSRLRDNDGNGSQQRGKLGLAVGDLTPDMRQQLNIPSHVKGAAMQSVRPASPAEDAGLQPGDVIQEVNRKPVTECGESSRTMCIRFQQERTFCCWSGRDGGASYRVVHPAQGEQNGE